MSAPENREAFTGFGPMQFSQPTMTLRDYFASSFLSGSVASNGNDNIPGVPPSASQKDVDAALCRYWSRVAHAAYIAADAMLAERKKGGAA